MREMSWSFSKQETSNPFASFACSMSYHLNHLLQNPAFVRQRELGSLLDRGQVFGPDVVRVDRCDRIGSYEHRTGSRIHHACVDNKQRRKCKSRPRMPIRAVSACSPTGTSMGPAWVTTPGRVGLCVIPVNVAELQLARLMPPSPSA